MRVLLRKFSSLCSFRENTRLVGAGWSRLPDLSNSKGVVRKSISQLTHGHQRQFCSVSSSSWRSELLPKQLPGILLPPNDSDSERRPLFNVDAPLSSLPVPDQYHCCGSNFGWLVLVDDDLSMHLFNPVSGQKIQLPHATTLPPPNKPSEGGGGHHKRCIRKAFLSCPPSDKTLVLAICGFVHRSLAFCRLGDQEWTPIKSIGRRIYVDAIYHNDKFYAMYNPGGVVTCDIHSSPPKVIEYAYPPKSEFVYMTRYLVQSEGYLFNIGRKDGCPDNSSDEDDDDESLSQYREDYSGNMWWVNNFSSDDEGDVETEEDDNPDGESHQHDGVETDTTNEDSKEEEKVTGDVESEEESSNSESESAEEGEESDSAEEGNSEKKSRVFTTRGFKVFRLNMKDDGCACEKKWEKVDNIGDNAFFVGCYNTSFSHTASEVPGCKPNSIYFTDSGWGGRGNDMGVFNLEDKSVEEVCPIQSKPTGSYSCPHSPSQQKPPFWFYSSPV